MNAGHYLGALLVLLVISALGLYSGMRVKSAGDFAVGGRNAGTGIVAGTIIGTFAGGSSTIGTAQLAFTYGFSAWWFTLGGGLACLVLGLVYARRLYDTGLSTMPQMLSREYGQKTATVAAILNSLGTFLSIVAQFLSGMALIVSVSGMPSFAAAGIAVAFTLAYVIFGGLWSTGLVGVAKAALLLVGVGLCGGMALHQAGGWPALAAALPAERYFSLVARGPAIDLGAGLSLVVGVLTTQTYIQAVVSGKSFIRARAGALVSAFLIPLIGLAGVAVGLYMKIRMPGIDPSTALPVFIMAMLPPFFAGVTLATLLVTVVGTAAGLALGLSSMLCNDICRFHVRKSLSEKDMLRLVRLTLAGILLAAALVTAGNAGSLILSWSVLSMGLRGAVTFGILTAALFFPGRISSSLAMWAMGTGLACVVLGKPLFGDMMDPLFIGVAGSLLVLLAGGMRPGGFR
ncbi:MAG: sodium:solute symporter family protein [Desulfovibrio sp.]|jgi:SSS family solute:Na+ symporter|nr:sodium:solute symporter family protein [Desulfovibrio sp.]